MRYEFGSAGAVCSIKESSGPQNQQVHIVLKASKSAGAKGDVPYICIPCILRYPKVRMISFIGKISEIKHTSSNFSPQLKEDLKAVSNFIQFNQAYLSIFLVTWGKWQKKNTSTQYFQCQFKEDLKAVGSFRQFNLEKA